MRKLLAVVLVLCFGFPAFAANTATDLGSLPIRINGSGPVEVYKINIDTVDTDLTVHTPPSGNMACVVGVQLSETSAANLKFKSSTSTEVWIPELATNQGILTKIGPGVDFCTFSSQALVVQSSANISNMVLYVINAKNLNIGE